MTYNAGYVQQTVNGPFHLLVPYSHANKLFKKLKNENLVTSQVTELLEDVPQHNMPF